MPPLTALDRILAARRFAYWWASCKVIVSSKIGTQVMYWHYRTYREQVTNGCQLPLSEDKVYEGSLQKLLVVF